MIHYFEQSAEWALEQAQQPWVEALYRQAFHNYENGQIIRADGWAQRGGIDRKINLTSARSVFVEEKFRGEDYYDFYLEYWSDKARRKLGWIAQDLLADYVAYIFVPSRRMYLLPFLDLRRAWRKEGPQWIRRYKTKPGENVRYTTRGLIVPIPTVLSAIYSGMCFTHAGESQATALDTQPQLLLNFAEGKHA